MFNPAPQHFVVRCIHVNKLNSHADPRLHDSHHTQRFHLLVLTSHRHSDSRARRQRLARADERSAHRNVRRDAFSLRPALHIQQFNVGCKRVANTIPAVAHRHAPRVAFQCSVVHEDYVAHSRLRRVANGFESPGARPVSLSLPQSASPASLSKWVPRQKDNSFPAPSSPFPVPSRYYLERQTTPSPQPSDPSSHASLNLGFSFIAL